MRLAPGSPPKPWRDAMHRGDHAVRLITYYRRPYRQTPISKRRAGITSKHYGLLVSVRFALDISEVPANQLQPDVFVRRTPLSDSTLAELIRCFRAKRTVPNVPKTAGLDRSYRKTRWFGAPSHLASWGPRCAVTDGGHLVLGMFSELRRSVAVLFEAVRASC